MYSIDLGNPLTAGILPTSGIQNIGDGLLGRYEQKKADKQRMAAKDRLLTKNKELRAQVESLLVALWDAAENGLIDDKTYNRIIRMSDDLEEDHNKRNDMLEKYDL